MRMRDALIIILLLIMIYLASLRAMIGYDVKTGKVVTVEGEQYLCTPATL